MAAPKSIRALTLILAATAASGQTPAEKVRLEITTDFPHVCRRVADSIKTTLENNSRQDMGASTVVYKMNGSFSMYILYVRDRNNREVPKKEYPHLELSSASVLSAHRPCRPSAI